MLYLYVPWGSENMIVEVIEDSVVLVSTIDHDIIVIFHILLPPWVQKGYFYLLFNDHIIIDSGFIFAKNITNNHSIR